MIRIYTLEDPTVEGIQGVRYVGKTTQTFSQRQSVGYDAHCKNWLKSLERKGIEPYQREIDRVEDEEWGYTDEDGKKGYPERFYIQEYRNLGCPLTNTTDGGEGGAAVGHPVSPETRAKLSAYQKGRNRTSTHKERIGDSNARVYFRVTDKDGNSHVIRNLTKFCRENNLHPKKMFEVARGKQAHHRGWKCERLGEESGAQN